MKIFITVLSVLLLTSCSSKGVAIINNKQGDVDTLKHEIFADYIKIYVGDSITHKPTVSQIYINEADTNYVLLDNKSLFFFDLRNGNLVKSINFGEEYGSLNNYSGFYLDSLDSIYMFNYATGDVFITNGDAEKLNTYNIKKLVKQKDIKFDPTPLNGSPMIRIGDDIVLTGWIMGKVQELDKMAVSCVLNTKSSTLEPIVGYPDNYQAYDFGGVYFNMPYNTLSENNNIVYSFPAEHNVILFSPDGKTSKMYAGSIYIDQIMSSPKKITYDKQDRLDYYLREPSYSNIFYDKYNDLYYRFVEHPTDEYDGMSIDFNKPFSIIVLDRNLKIVGETEIFNGHYFFDRSNMHIVPEGIIVKNISDKDENLINFSLIKINI